MRRYMQVCLVIMIIAAAGFGVGLVVFMSFGNNGEELSEATANEMLFHVIEVEEPVAYSEDLYIEDEIVDDGRIRHDTMLIYEYYHSSTGEIEIVEEYPGYLLQNMTAEELSDMLVNWELISFSPQEVRLRKNVEEVIARPYIIGTYGGYIAVFYPGTGEQIKELTTRPISTLPEAEQQRLMEGIEVNGSEELLRALEDFSS